MYEPQELLWRGPFPCHDYIFWQGNGKFLVPGDKKIERSPGRYQELDLFIKVLRLLCPNLTDVSRGWILTLETRLGHRPFPSIFPESYHLVTNWLWKEGNGQEPVNFVKDEEVRALASYSCSLVQSLKRMALGMHKWTGIRTSSRHPLRSYYWNRLYNITWTLTTKFLSWVSAGSISLSLENARRA